MVQNQQRKTNQNDRKRILLYQRKWRVVYELRRNVKTQGKGEKPT